ncbi:MAG: B3/4 domain-containing protein [Gudongella sp.]|nr:B3/4 domain-containing protein [Gudongella sp.]
MKKFIVEKEFWEVFPNAKIGIVLLKGIDNRVKDENGYLGILKDAEKEALKHLPDDSFSNNQVIKVWREAFQKFKTKKGARSSIEALLKRAHNGKGIGGINPLVDIYNSVSLRYALPCGGEDMDTFEGDIRLTKAVGDEDFMTLGSEKSEPPYEGEIVYKDSEGAICRCWNWRESVRTMLREETENAFICIESVDASRDEDLKAALDELASLAKDNLGGENEIHIVDMYNNSIEIQ